MAAAQWLYQKPVDTAALESMGFGAVAVQTAAPEVWPCCEAAVKLLCVLGTQWRLAPMVGPVGLDYGAIRPTLQLMEVPRAQWSELFKDLQVLEAAAVTAMRGGEVQQGDAA